MIYFTTFLSFQSGKKTVKAVLWVSADGLRVVDDKTKVSKCICVCVASVSLFHPPLCLPLYLPHHSLGSKDSMCPTVIQSTHHTGILSMSSFSAHDGKQRARKQSLRVKRRQKCLLRPSDALVVSMTHIHLCVIFFLLCFHNQSRHIFHPQTTNKSLILSQFNDATLRLTTEGSTMHLLS